MFSKTMHVGEAIEIGEVAAIRVEAKSGCMVKLAFFTDLPLRLVTSGIIRQRFTPGIVAGQRRVLEDFRSVA